MIWNVETKKFVHKEVLDLEDSEQLKEDPGKLFVIGSDNLYLYLRTNNKKGVKIISLEDGSSVSEIPLMHTNAIL